MGKWLWESGSLSTGTATKAGGQGTGLRMCGEWAAVGLALAWQPVGQWDTRLLRGVALGDLVCR